MSSIRNHVTNLYGQPPQQELSDALLSQRWHQLQDLFNRPPTAKPLNNNNNNNNVKNNISQAVVHKPLSLQQQSSSTSITRTKNENIPPTNKNNNNILQPLSPSPSVKSIDSGFKNNNANKPDALHRRKTLPPQSEQRKQLNSHKPVNTSNTKKPIQQQSSFYDDILAQQQKQQAITDYKKQQKYLKEQQQKDEKQRIKQFKQNLSAVKAHISRADIINSNSNNYVSKSTDSILNKKSSQSALSSPTVSSNSKPAHVTRNQQRHMIEPAIQRTAKSLLTSPNKPIISSAEQIKRDRQLFKKPHKIPEKPNFEIVIKDNNDNHSHNNNNNNVIHNNNVINNTTINTSDEVLDKTVIRPNPTQQQQNNSKFNVPSSSADNIARLNKQIDETKTLVIDWIGQTLFDTLYAHIKTLKPIDLNTQINVSLPQHEPIANLLKPTQYKVLRHIQKLVLVENMLNKQKL